MINYGNDTEDYMKKPKDKKNNKTTGETDLPDNTTPASVGTDGAAAATQTVQEAQDGPVTFRYKNDYLNVQSLADNLEYNVQGYMNHKKWDDIKKKEFYNAYKQYLAALREGRLSIDSAGSVLDTKGSLNNGTSKWYDEDGRIVTQDEYNAMNSRQRRNVHASFFANREVADYLNKISAAVLEAQRNVKPKQPNYFDFNRDGLENSLFNYMYPGGVDYVSFLELDPYDEKTKKRALTNRMKRIGDFIENTYESYLSDDLDFSNSKYRTRDKYDEALAAFHILNREKATPNEYRLALLGLGFKPGTLDVILSTKNELNGSADGSDNDSSSSSDNGSAGGYGSGSAGDSDNGSEDGSDNGSEDGSDNDSAYRKLTPEQQEYINSTVNLAREIYDIRWNNGTYALNSDGTRMNRTPIKQYTFNNEQDFIKKLSGVGFSEINTKNTSTSNQYAKLKPFLQGIETYKPEEVAVVDQGYYSGWRYLPGTFDPDTFSVLMWSSDYKYLMHMSILDEYFKGTNVNVLANFKLKSMCNEYIKAKEKQEKIMKNNIIPWNKSSDQNTTNTQQAQGSSTPAQAKTSMPATRQTGGTLSEFSKPGASAEETKPNAVSTKIGVTDTTGITQEKPAPSRQSPDWLGLKNNMYGKHIADQKIYEKRMKNNIIKNYQQGGYVPISYTEEEQALLNKYNSASNSNAAAAEYSSNSPTQRNLSEGLKPQDYARLASCAIDIANILYPGPVGSAIAGALSDATNFGADLADGVKTGKALGTLFANLGLTGLGVFTGVGDLAKLPKIAGKLMKFTPWLIAAAATLPNAPDVVESVSKLNDPKDCRHFTATDWRNITTAIQIFIGSGKTIVNKKATDKLKDLSVSPDKVNVVVKQDGNTKVLQFSGQDAVDIKNARNGENPVQDINNIIHKIPDYWKADLVTVNKGFFSKSKAVPHPNAIRTAYDFDKMNDANGYYSKFIGKRTAYGKGTFFGGKYTYKAATPPASSNKDGGVLRDTKTAVAPTKARMSAKRQTGGILSEPSKPGASAGETKTNAAVTPPGVTDTTGITQEKPTPNRQSPDWLGLKNNMYDGIGFATTLAFNKRMFDLSRKMPVYLTDKPTQQQRWVTGDYGSVMRGNRAAGTLSHLAATPVTSDGQAQVAGQLEYWLKGLDAKDNADALNDKTVAASKEAMQAQNANNIKDAYSVAMGNRSNLHSKKVNSISAQDTYNRYNYESLISLLDKRQAQIIAEKERTDQYKEMYNKEYLRNDVILDPAKYGIMLTDKEQQLLRKVFSGLVTYSSLSDADKTTLSGAISVVNSAVANKLAEKYGVKIPRLTIDTDSDYEPVIKLTAEDNDGIPKDARGGTIRVGIEVQKLKNKVEKMKLWQRHLEMRMKNYQKDVDRANRSASAYLRSQRGK